MENMQARNEKKSYCLSNERAAELMSKTERCSVIVTDKSKGISSKADERAENETQRLSREKVELSRRVEDKYNSNSENNKER